MNPRGILTEDEVFALLNRFAKLADGDAVSAQHIVDFKTLTKSHERMRNELLRVTEKVAVAHLALSNILSGHHQPEPRKS